MWCGGRGSREGGCGVKGGTAGKVGVVWREGQQGRWVWCEGRDSREGECGVKGGTAGKVGVVWREGQQ